MGVVDEGPEGAATVSAEPSGCGASESPPRTYSLAEVVAEHGLDEVSKDPIRWLSMRLNRGELRGVRFGRVWRMRRSDIEFMLERYSNDGKAKPIAGPDPMPEPTFLADGVSRRSRHLRGMP